MRDPLSNCYATSKVNLAIIEALKGEFEKARDLSYTAVSKLEEEL